MKNAKSRFRKANNKNKYNAKAVVVDGLRFDSTGESQEWFKLRKRMLAGEIKNLRRQVKYDFVINGVLVCSYKADFEYEENGVLVTADFKGMITEIFKIKANLFRATQGRDILVVKK
jgi:hypothetical protein